jgi:hypothetical protein
LVGRSQQLGQIPAWLNAGTVQLAPSKFSLHGAATARHPVVNETGPTQLLNDVGLQESRIQAS